MRNLYKWFRKVAINQYDSTDWSGDEKRPMEYRREDLSKWAKEAFNNDEESFYAKPVNPTQPYGQLELCEPEYRYKLRRSLTQEEMNELFGEEVKVDAREFFMSKYLKDEGEIIYE